MARIDPKCSGTDVAVPCTPIQPTLAIEIGSQSQVGSTHDGFFEVDNVEPDDYVALHDEFMYFSDVDDEVNHVGQEVNVDFDYIETSGVHEEPTVDGVAECEKEFSLDPANPKIEAGALFPDVYAFRKALRHFALLPPNVIDFLKRNHKAIWCRSQFSEISKVDYVNNNISECFNAWIKGFKGLHLVDLLDKIRQLLLEKFNIRRAIVSKFNGKIVPSVIKELNESSRNGGRPKIVRGSNDYGEVSGIDTGGNIWRHVVELDSKQCSCREWQITGKPCMHAVSFICSLRGAKIEDYVHEYYSVDRFKVTYAGRIPAMPDKSQWEKVNLQAQVLPPVAKRPPGRPRKERIPGCLEPGTRRQQCKRCKQYGHQQRTCKVGETGNPRVPKGNKKRLIMHLQSPQDDASSTQHQ